MLQADLKILGGKHQGKLIPLTTKKFLVGREQDCHLKPNSDLVSRHHCVFTIDDYAVRLRDLGSTNGTHVNGVPLRGEIGLQSGDRIRIGKLELELVVRQASAAAPTAPLSSPSIKLDTSTEMETVPGGMTAEIPVYTGDSSPTADTMFEVGTQTDTAAIQTAAIQTPAQDTAIISGGAYPPGYAQPGAPGYPAMMPYGMPGYPQQGMPYPQQPMMPYPQQPMGYPQQYPMGYGQPMYPGYPGYAPGMPGYAPTEAATAVAEPVADKSAFPAVKLPPPEETGVKAPAPAPAPVATAPVAGAAPAPAASGEKPSTSAADIIKQYMQKRSR